MIIGTVELIPIIGQIASLFETAVASAVLGTHTSHTPTLSGDSEPSQNPIQILLAPPGTREEIKSEETIEALSNPPLTNKTKFESYQKRQQAAGGLVDLIVGRGRIKKRYRYPILVENRYDSIRSGYYQYTPLTLVPHPISLEGLELRESPAVKRSKAAPYYNIGLLSIDLTPEL